MAFRRDPVRDIVAWFAGNECHDLDDAGFVAWTGRRLCAAGLPLDRLTLHLRTLHPEFLDRTVAWSPDCPVEIADREHGVEQSAVFARSPSARSWRRANG